MNPEIPEPEVGSRWDSAPAAEVASLPEQPPPSKTILNSAKGAGPGLNPAPPSSHKAIPSTSIKPTISAAKQKLAKKKERKERRKQTKSKVHKESNHSKNPKKSKEATTTSLFRLPPPVSRLRTPPEGISQQPPSNPYGPQPTFPLANYSALPQVDAVMRRIIDLQAASPRSRNMATCKRELTALFESASSKNNWIYIRGVRNHFGLRQLGLGPYLDVKFRRPGEKALPPPSSSVPPRKCGQPKSHPSAPDPSLAKVDGYTIQRDFRVVFGIIPPPPAQPAQIRTPPEALNITPVRSYSAPSTSEASPTPKTIGFPLEPTEWEPSSALEAEVAAGMPLMPQDTNPIHLSDFTSSPVRFPPAEATEDPSPDSGFPPVEVAMEVLLPSPTKSELAFLLEPPNSPNPSTPKPSSPKETHQALPMEVDDAREPPHAPRESPSPQESPPENSQDIAHHPEFPSLYAGPSHRLSARQWKNFKRRQARKGVKPNPPSQPPPMGNLGRSLMERLGPDPQGPQARPIRRKRHIALQRVSELERELSEIERELVGENSGSPQQAPTEAAQTAPRRDLLSSAPPLPTSISGPRPQDTPRGATQPRVRSLMSLKLAPKLAPSPIPSLLSLPLVPPPKRPCPGISTSAPPAPPVPANSDKKRCPLCNSLQPNLPAASESPLRPIIDTHMHIDLMFSKLPPCPMEAQSLDLLEARLNISDHHVEKVVTNYCFSEHWPSSHHHLHNDRDHRVHVTYGIHPNEAHLSNSAHNVARLEALVMDPRCVALGEVGLDYSRGCLCPHKGHGNSCVATRFQQQKDLLKTLLPIARRHSKPLVLHCRGKTSEDNGAAFDTLQMLWGEGMSDHPIHRHCFVGTVEELEEWAGACSNSYFGITAKNIQAPSQRAAIKAIPASRLLLETDSPFLCHPQARPNAPLHINSPWLLSHLVQEVASIRGVSPHTLIGQCNANARQLYTL